MDSESLDFISLLTALESHIKETSEFTASLPNRLFESIIHTSNGISLLTLRSYTLLNYLINLATIILQKSKGRYLSELHNSVILSIINDRTVLEKIKPLELKIKYQIDKYVSMAASGSSINKQHPLSYKPIPKNLIPRAENKETVSVENGELLINESATQLYRPPMISADPGIISSKSKNFTNKEQRAQKHAIQSSLIKEMRDEFSDEPKETPSTGVIKSKLALEKVSQKRSYEEENFMRIPTSKKQRKNETKIQSNLDNITDFGYADFLEDGKFVKRGLMGKNNQKKNNVRTNKKKR